MRALRDSTDTDVCFFFLLKREIEQFVPSGSPVAALQNSPVVTELKSLMEQVETIKAERDVVENEIKNANCDMSKYNTTSIIRHPIN